MTPHALIDATDANNEHKDDLGAALARQLEEALSFLPWRQVKAPWSQDKVKAYLMEGKGGQGAPNMASLPSGVVNVSFFKSALHKALCDPGYLDLATWPFKKADATALMPLLLTDKEGQWAYPYCWSDAVRSRVETLAADAHVGPPTEETAAKSAVQSHKARRKEKKHPLPHHSEAEEDRVSEEIADTLQLPREMVSLVLKAYQKTLVSPLPVTDALGNTIVKTPVSTPSAKLQRSPTSPGQGQKQKSKQYWHEKEREWHDLWDHLHLYEKGISHLTDASLRSLLQQEWCKSEGSALINTFFALFYDHASPAFFGLPHDAENTLTASVYSSEFTAERHALQTAQASEFSKSAWSPFFKEVEHHLTAHAPLGTLSSAFQRFSESRTSSKERGAGDLFLPLKGLVHPVRDLTTVRRATCKAIVHHLTLEDQTPALPPLHALLETLRAFYIVATGFAVPLGRKAIEPSLHYLTQWAASQTDFVAMRQVLAPKKGEELEEAEHARRMAATAMYEDTHHRVDKNGEKGEGKRVTKSTYRKVRDIEKGRKKKEKTRQKHGGHRGPESDNPFTLSPTLNRAATEKEETSSSEEEEEAEEEPPTEEGDLHNPNRSPMTDFYDFDGVRLPAPEEEKKKGKISYRKQRMTFEHAMAACTELWQLYRTFTQQGGVWPFGSEERKGPSRPNARRASTASSSSATTNKSTQDNVEKLIDASLTVSAIGVGLSLHALQPNK